MNVIIAYLETMFSTYPQTPRLLEAKAELQSMMEDAYVGLIAEGRSENEAVGQVIRDFGNLAEVAPVLGITADITASTAASAASAAPAAPAHQAITVAAHPPITLTEAQGYAAALETIRFRVAASVAMFVLSPVLLVLLPTLAEASIVPFDAGIATAIGIVALLILVLAGVLTLVNTSRDLAPFKRITEMRFSPDAAVTAWATELSQQHERGRIKALQIAIALWIMSPAPLIVFALVTPGSAYQDVWSVFGVVLVLMFVAAGLVILIPAAWAHGVQTKLVTEPLEAAESEHSIVGVIAAIYWPLAVVIYLAWSFLGNAWYISWIIWPIAGVLFGAIAAGSGAIASYRKARR